MVQGGDGIGDDGRTKGNHGVTEGDLNGDGVGDLLIGAPRKAVDGGGNTGEAYAFFGSRDLAGDVWLEEGFPGIRLLGDTPAEQFGKELTPAGDFNGDRNPDLLVVTPPWNFRELSTGRAYLIYGGPAPLRLYRIDPDHGPKRGGTTVSLRGSGFSANTRVFFGGASLDAVLISSSEIRVVTGSVLDPGAVEVKVTGDGQEFTLPAGYEYTPDFPVIDLRRLEGRGLILEGDPAEVSDRTLAHSGGRQVAFGDLDGDGADELLVQSKVQGAWRVILVHGGSGLPPVLPAFDDSPHLTVVRSAAGVSIANVAVVGDVNADGLLDAAIGEPGGAGYLLFGRRDLPAELVVEVEVALGTAVRLDRATVDPLTPLLFLTALGDLTGDGIDDFATGFQGEVLIVQGGKSWPERLDLDEDLEPVRARIRGIFGAAKIDAAGDVDGDRLGDLLVEGSVVGGTASAWLIFGRPDLVGALDAPTLVAEGSAVRIEAEASRFPAFDISLAGDATGDGFADLLIGVGWGGRLTNQGMVYLVPGGPPSLPVISLVESPAAPDGVVRILGEGSMEQAGQVGRAGDFNADGFADFLVGSPGFQDGGPGNVFLVLGGPSLPGEIELRRIGGRGIEIRGRNTPGGAGHFVGPFGDLNGDRQPDFAFGELATLDGGPARVYVIYGPYGPKSFVRGDANSDRLVDLSDAVSILSYLFLGGAGPLCQDAMDCDDQGSIEITDAIRILEFLFLGGPAPPAPHPLEGRDPTTDPLSCLGF